MLSLRETLLCLTGTSDVAPEADRPIAAVRSDSRMVGPGDLFVCLHGERFDGHNFAAQALEKGAVAVVASSLLPEADPEKVIMVRDTVQALGRLARCARDRTRAKVAGITGSAGKTTLKEMLAMLLSAKGPTAKNPGNFNNQIGLPLAMLGAADEAEFWVMEAGISRQSDMEELGRILAPDLAIVLNVGPAHTEGLGGIEGVAKAKASLLAHAAPGGAGLVCADYPLLLAEARRIMPEVKTFSTQNPEADYFCSQERVEPGGCGVFSLRLPGFTGEVFMPRTGEHMAECAAAAAGAAHLLGVHPDRIPQGLSKPVSVPGRFAARECGSWILIDDTYNANPLSTLRSARAARHVAGEGHLFFVLGEMKELGDCRAESHRDVGRALASLAPRAVFFTGESVREIREGLEAGGFTGAFHAPESPAAFVTAWRSMPREGGTLLFKGSRSMRMETFLAALAAELEGRN